MKHLILVLLLALAGCSFQNPVDTAQVIKDRSLTVEEAARKTVTCLPLHAGPDAFQVRDQARYEAGLLVLFTAICPAPDNPRMIYDIVGYALVEQHQGLWTTLFSNWSGEARQSHNQAILIGQGGQAGQQMFYGRTLNPNVAMVEIRFSSGKVRDLQIKNQVFHQSITGADQLCELRALAADGTVLEQRDLQAAAEC
jgi:hypothetical protein